MPSIATLKILMKEEMVQLAEEGCEVQITAADVDAASGSVDSLMNVYNQLRSLSVRDGFPYKEPTSLDGIRRERPQGPRQMNVRTSAKKLTDRLHGAWLGRVAGCMLGKPVEVRNADTWPLSDYFPEQSNDAEGKPAELNPECCRCNIQAGIPDDDTNYTIIALKLMETKGYNFTTADVGKLWLDLLPYNAVCTAERRAYANLINELPMAEVPTYLNPYREWIGAQIRGDFFGYATPGHPELAAELAWRDATLSHVRNGVYGEMLVAAMLSAALVTDDVEKVIRTGLSEIPQKCRLAEAANDVLAWRKLNADWLQTFEAAMGKYGHYHPVHTINNAAFVLIGLLYGEKDFSKTVGISVMCGLDTDCNGATAGSICGAMLGAEKIPSNWSWPLHDTLYSTVSGFGENKISDLAARTKRLWR